MDVLGIGRFTGGEFESEVVEQVGGVRGGVLAEELARLDSARAAQSREFQVAEGARIGLGDLGGRAS